MGKKIIFKDDPFKAFMPSVNQPVTTVTTVTTKNPLPSSPNSQVQKNEQVGASQGTPNFRYGEQKSQASLPLIFVKRTYQLSPEHRSKIEALAMMKRWLVREVLKEALDRYFADETQIQDLKDFKKLYPKRFEKLFTYWMDSESSETTEFTTPKNSS